MNEKIARQRQVASEARARAFNDGADLVSAVAAGRTAAALVRSGISADAAIREAVERAVVQPRQPAAQSYRAIQMSFGYTELALAFAAGAFVCAALLTMGAQ